MAEAEEVTFNVTLVPFPILSRASEGGERGRFVPDVSALFRATECAAVALPRNNGSPGARAPPHAPVFVRTVRNLQHVRIPALGQITLHVMPKS